jgi:hypothetical protein
MRTVLEQTPWAQQIDNKSATRAGTSVGGVNHRPDHSRSPAVSLSTIDIVNAAGGLSASPSCIAR